VSRTDPNKAAGRAAASTPAQGGDRALPDLSLPEWVTLAVICEQPTHGFAIAALTIPDGPIGRAWQIPRPLIYRAIRRLAEAELITADAVESSALGPQRTRYRATRAGRRAVQRWLETPVDHVRDVRSQLLVKLALLDRLGRSPAELLAGQRARFNPIVQALSQDEQATDGFDRVLIAWRRASAAAALAFLDDVGTSLTEAGFEKRRR
jgi:PadR family transcriptional regulator AphA